MNEKKIKPVAYIYTDFPEKFGIPKQSGLINELPGKIIFEPEYQSLDAVRGIEGFSHLWLIWGFSENKETNHSLTVRPPHLGGNERMGVFATRSPFRPNGLGLSSVRLTSVAQEGGKLVLYVKGIDMVSGTPIYDIKPYLPYSDSHAEAEAGFTNRVKKHLQVNLPEALLPKKDPSLGERLKAVLMLDPRPGYQQDETRIYGMDFAGYRIRFRVDKEVLYVEEIDSL